MEREGSLPVSLVQWVDALRERNLGQLAHIAIDLLQVWGYAGSQLLWMLAPFLSSATVTPLAEALEDPETLKALRARLVEGASG